MIPVLLLANALAAEPSDPLDPSARLELAERLLSTAGREEQGLEVLARLMEERDATRHVLLDVLSRMPPRPAHAALYEALAKGPEGPAQLFGRVRYGWVETTDPATRARGLATLRTLTAQGIPDAAIALGDALLEGHDLAGARNAYQRAAWPTAGERLALVLLAQGRAAEAGRTWTRASESGAVVAVAVDEAMERAVATPGDAATAHVLQLAGFPRAAEALLAAPPPLGARRTAEESTLLAELRMARGDTSGAVDAWRAALSVADDSAHRHGLARALLASGRLKEAADYVGDDPALRAALELRRALLTPDRADDAPAAKAAWAAAPEEPSVATAWGEILRAEDRAEAAVPVLTRAVALDPADDRARGQLVVAALAAGHVGVALDAGAGALAAAGTPGERKAAVDQLVGLLVVDAEQRKTKGQPDDAREELSVALALRPQSPAALRALGGLLWQQGEAEKALVLYRKAAALDPSDHDAPLAAARLAVQLGHREEAETLLAALPAGTPDVRTLRDELLRVEKTAAARALAQKDPERAVEAWKQAIATWPHDPSLLHGLADTYLQLGRRQEALAIQRAALALAPNDPWNLLGEITSLLALGRGADARERLEQLPADLPPEAERIRDQIKGRLLREDGERARAAGDDAAARAAFEQAYELDPDPWTAVALAGSLASAGKPLEALDLYRRIRADEKDPTLLAVVARGEAGVLEASGQGDLAARVLRAEQAARPDEETQEQLEALEARLAVRRADALRRAGRVAEARAALAELAVENGNQPMVQAAWAAVLLEAGKPAEALDAAERALLREPRNLWALDIAERAGRACGCSDRVVPLLRVAAAGGGGPEIARRAKRAQVAAAAEGAIADAKHGKRAQGRRAVDDARALAGDDVASGIILAEADDALGRDGRALRTLTRLHSSHPEDVDAALALARHMQDHGRWREALAVLEPLWADTRDPRLSDPIAALRRDHLPRPAAGEVVAPQVVTKEAVVRAPPTTTPRPSATSPVGSVGFGVLSRAGVAGVGQELATFVPVHAGPPPLGPVALDLEAVLIRVTDGEEDDYGVAPSLGFSTLRDRPWAAWGRVGTSPLGFKDGAYPVWFAGAKGQVGNPLAFGVETGRAPVLDSRASWVGDADPFTGAAYGRVYHTWLGGWAGLGAPWGTDFGVLSRLGQSEGIGLDPVGRFELVSWLGQRIGSPTRNLRLGAEGVAFSHQYQVDGFQSGQGAFYSPPIFAVATGRLDARWHGVNNRVAICGGVGAGMQYAGGGPSLYFAPGTAFTHNGRLSARWEIASGWGVMLEGGWLVAGPWHQETTLFRFGWGLAGPPVLTTFATPSMGIRYQGEDC